MDVAQFFKRILTCTRASRAPTLAPMNMSMCIKWLDLFSDARELNGNWKFISSHSPVEHILQFIYYVRCTQMYDLFFFYQDAAPTATRFQLLMENAHPANANLFLPKRTPSIRKLFDRAGVELGDKPVSISHSTAIRSMLPTNCLSEVNATLFPIY